MFYTITVTNMVVLQNSEDTSFKFNPEGICTSGH